MKANRWNYINWGLLVVASIYISKVINLHFDQWQWWGLMIIIIMIGFTAAVAEERRIRGKSK